MKPILVTGVGGNVGGVGEKIVENLLSEGVPVRAFVFGRMTLPRSWSVKALRF